MRVQELMIGNWVQCTGRWKSKGLFDRDPGRIFQWDEHDWYTLIEWKRPIYNISPLPLTEDWLKKFGFEKYTDTNPAMKNQKIYRRGQLAVEKRMKLLSVIWYDANDDYGTSMCIIVKHVHQLQNLYFALTGEELTINDQTPREAP